MKMIGEMLDTINCDVYQKEHNAKHPVVSKVAGQVMLHLFPKAVINETLDAHILTGSSTNIASHERFGEKAPVEFIYVLLLTFVRL